jgi:transcriptional regulator NrdR family protein|tara:strand:+ start:54 stop:245 length:192 start_codon:yes stop_codon:yes gene_type:complete
MTLAVTHCPKCHKKLQAKDSRPHTAYGFPTVKRRRVCLICNFRITTIELPILIGNEVFEEDGA